MGSVVFFLSSLKVKREMIVLAEEGNSQGLKENCSSEIEQMWTSGRRSEATRWTD